MSLPPFLERQVTIWIIASWVCFIGFSEVAQASTLTSWSLPQLAHKTMAAYFNATSSNERTQSIPLLTKQQLHPPAPFQKSAGVFVTLSHNGKTRGCWGSLYPEQKNIALSTIYATLGALTKEYRYPPIKPYEINKLSAQVTVIDRIVPVATTQGINPMRQGLFVRSGGKSGILLPGEASDRTYQLIQALLKAGIQKNEAYQIYRIDAHVYH